MISQPLHYKPRCDSFYRTSLYCATQMLPFFTNGRQDLAPTKMERLSHYDACLVVVWNRTHHVSEVCMRLGGWSGMELIILLFLKGSMGQTLFCLIFGLFLLPQKSKTSQAMFYSLDSFYPYGPAAHPVI